MPPTTIFNDQNFWRHFKNKVQSMSWKCNFPTDILLESIDKDAILYTDATIFKHRRQIAQQWVQNETLWVETVLGVCKEIADQRDGVYSQQLRNLKMLDALEDFVEHINCFYSVASVMTSKGQPVKALSQFSSELHDIDKIDPVMLVGYSERFEDNVNTRLWNLCVSRHTSINPHHQTHCMWHDCCNDYNLCSFCEDTKEKALREMVCDKVSRHVQKDLNGAFSREMWNVDMAFFKGLPYNWLHKASIMLEDMI
ncbi:uncharacterized protein LOC118186040 [Stegodyphus dumicola]|uniref:uncharacterized protein LOC118186040 n=1 Tax=Stegodyphus dumicola TaxID=202533 RepID=UPI0015ADDE86|nr:uncharacterized protein LOC118186040 [Stegodyphus dumicola]